MTRICCKCKIEKTLEEFHRNGVNVNGHSKGIRRMCKICQNAENRASFYRNRPARRKAQKKWEKKQAQAAQHDPVIHAKFIVESARARARRKKLPFNLTYTDISIPEVCPVLGIPLIRGVGALSDNSVSIDKIIPSLGYIPGNVIIISYKANRIKSSATPEELFKIANFYKELWNESTETSTTVNNP